MNHSEWADKDYYGDLGVSSSASAADIKRAYRKLARENHPDSHPGDKAAEERFKRAAEAYDVVGDEKKRAEYDQLKALLSSGGFGGRGRSGFPGGFRRSAEEFRVDDLFGGGSQGFGGDGGLGDILGGFINRGGAASRRARPSRGADISTEVTLSFREAVEGTTLPLSLQGLFECATCGGSGSQSGRRTRCAACSGTGFVSEEKGAFGFSRPCTVCQGTGEVVTDPCPDCSGTGSTVTTKTITIKVPAGADDGQKLRVRKNGQAGPAGTPPGDLLVTIHVDADPVFTRSGANLEVTVPVTFAELVLGGEITVPTLDQPVRLKVPAGTANKRKLRLKNRGVPAHGRTAAGDLLVTVDVQVPKHLDDAAMSALRVYAQAERDSGFNPRGTRS